MKDYHAMPFDGRICPIKTCRSCGRTIGVVGDTFCNACVTTADVAAFEARRRDPGPQDVVATTKRERGVYRGGPKEIRE